jgi:hypothetical protein
MPGKGVSRFFFVFHSYFANNISRDSAECVFKEVAEFQGMHAARTHLVLRFSHTKVTSSFKAMSA